MSIDGELLDPDEAEPDDAPCSKCPHDRSWHSVIYRPRHCMACPCRAFTTATAAPALKQISAEGSATS